MESAHKPVIIPPLKRCNNKKPRHKGTGNNSIPPNIRRIHSQDIVTRMPRDDVLSDKLVYNNTLITAFKSPDSPSFPKHRSLSQDVITLKSQTSTLESRSTTPDAETTGEFSLSRINSNCSSIRECLEEQNNSSSVLPGSNEIELGLFSSAASTCNSETEDCGSRGWASPSRNVNISLPEPLKIDNNQVESLEVESSATEECALNATEDHYLTLTGTIKRGKKAGQLIDVKLNMSREELEKLEADLSKKLQPKEQLFGTKSGIHIILLTLFCAPLVFLISGVYGFYLGTYTWYNIYLHFSDERTIWHKIFFCPLLVLTYPLWVPPMFVGIGLFAAAVQISWYYDRWISEVQDLEKGFFGWMCASLRLCECSPYEVIILNDIPPGKEAKITETTML